MIWYAGQVDLQPNPYAGSANNPMDHAILLLQGMIADPWFSSRGIRGPHSAATWALQNFRQARREEGLRASDREAWRNIVRLMAIAEDGEDAIAPSMPWRQAVRTFQQIWRTSPPDRSGYLDAATQQYFIGLMRQVASQPSADRSPSTGGQPSTFQRASFLQDAGTRVQNVASEIRQGVSSPGPARTKILVVAGVALVAGWLLSR